VSTCIAVIDDDAACRELLHNLLSEEGYAVHLQHLARGARLTSPAATGAGRCAPVCAGD
jgi:DNA-binding NtrC family response regulator